MIITNINHDMLNECTKFENSYFYKFQKDCFRSSDMLSLLLQSIESERLHP